MLTIDAQVHAYERDRASRPWRARLPGPPEVTGGQMVAAMDAVGVDGALLVSPFTIYGYDSSYALEVYAAHPRRFGLVKPVDPDDPRVEDTIAAWAATDGAVAIRLLFHETRLEDIISPGTDRVLAAAARHSLPVNVFGWGCLEQINLLAERNPQTKIVVDHLGLQQPFVAPRPARPFADLPKVLALAAHTNVAIKITGACTLSQEPFPFSDIWSPLARVFDAFGFERCMWGTDWTRAIDFLSYEEAVQAFRVTDRLTHDERAALMGGTLTCIYEWSPSPATHK
jgi:predicted TIM-barrel fold metal-dependent hydrolase